MFFAILFRMVSFSLTKTWVGYLKKSYCTIVKEYFVIFQNQLCAGLLPKLDGNIKSF